MQTVAIYKHFNMLYTESAILHNAAQKSYYAIQNKIFNFVKVIFPPITNAINVTYTKRATP